MLGVCLGHQAIAEAFGGRVVRAPAPVHGKTTAVQHDGRTVFEGVTQGFVATRYHSLVAERASLPDVLEVAAWDADGLVMGLRHRTFPVEGSFIPKRPDRRPALVRKGAACLARKPRGPVVKRDQDQRDQPAEDAVSAPRPADYLVVQTPAAPALGHAARTMFEGDGIFPVGVFTEESTRPHRRCGEGGFRWPRSTAEPPRRARRCGGGRRRQQALACTTSLGRAGRDGRAVRGAVDFISSTRTRRACAAWATAHTGSYSAGRSWPLFSPARSRRDEADRPDAPLRLDPGRGGGGAGVLDSTARRRFEARDAEGEG